MSFHKGVDNARHCAPPDRVAEQNGVVIRKIHRLPADSRTRRGIVHLPVGAAIVVVVINIVLGVRLRRHDLVHIRAQLIRDLLRRRFGVAGARKIDHQRFAVCALGSVGVRGAGGGVVGLGGQPRVGAGGCCVVRSARFAATGGGEQQCAQGEPRENLFHSERSFRQIVSSTQLRRISYRK